MNPRILLFLKATKLENLKIGLEFYIMRQLNLGMNIIASKRVTIGNERKHYTCYMQENE